MIELNQEGSQWGYQKKLPVNINQHCAVAMSETEMIIIGGYQKRRYELVHFAKSLHHLPYL